MFERILVPLDFSRSSELQVRVARDLARASGATLILLHVREPLIGPDGVLLPTSPIEDGPELNLQLEAMKADLVREGGVTVETRCVTGPPVSKIIDLVGEEGVDLIVMGTHGRASALGHGLRGGTRRALGAVSGAHPQAGERSRAYRVRRCPRVGRITCI